MKKTASKAPKTTAKAKAAPAEVKETVAKPVAAKAPAAPKTKKTKAVVPTKVDPVLDLEPVKELPAAEVPVAEMPVQEAVSAPAAVEVVEEVVLVEVEASPADTVADAPAIVEPAPVEIVSTCIVAQIDVGFGNQLFIRGEGAGLSWDKGISLDNIAADRWQIVLNGAVSPIVFKLLINDSTWSMGDDMLASPGTTTTVVPLF